MSARSIAAAPSIAALRRIAQRRLPKAVFDFFDGAADEELTLRRNQDDLAAAVFAPRAFVDVAERHLGTEILGRPAAAPLLVCPTGLAALGWPRADVALAQAAKEAGVPFVVSTSSSVRLEEIAEGAPGARLWFQVYMYKDRNLVRSLIERARDAGFEALVVTVDVPVLGQRRRDQDNRFTIPLAPTPRLVLDVLRCGRWTFDILRHGAPKMQNFVDYGHGTGLASLSELMTANMNPGSTWDDLDWIRQTWRGPLVIKGLLSRADAEIARSLGVEAIMVSNHGGRQLDGAPSSFSRLADMVDAAGPKVEVYMDGGVRSGSDVAKVIAAGARAAGVGRATLYGVSAGGKAGALRALQILTSGYDRTLALLGARSTAELDRRFLAGGSVHPVRGPLAPSPGLQAVDQDTAHPAARLHG